MLFKASCVKKAECGVINTLGNDFKVLNLRSHHAIRLGDVTFVKSLKNRFPADIIVLSRFKIDRPSFPYTSMAQPAILLFSSASIKASVLTRPPRLTLIRIDDGFMTSNLEKSELLRGRCKDGLVFIDNVKGAWQKRAMQGDNIRNSQQLLQGHILDTKCLAFFLWI